MSLRCTLDEGQVAGVRAGEGGAGPVLRRVPAPSRRQPLQSERLDVVELRPPAVLWEHLAVTMGTRTQHLKPTCKNQFQLY